MRRAGRLLVLACCLAAGTGCGGRRDGMAALRWMEHPAAHGPSTRADPADVVAFTRQADFHRGRDGARFAGFVDDIREGDVVAYYMTPWQARWHLLTLRFNALGYRLFKYGHLALVVEDPDRPGRLCLFSSESLVGANTREALSSLRDHNWDLYRLDHWERADRARLQEFVRLCRARAGTWRGYDFAGLLGLGNAGLRPQAGRDIARDYICSTVVLAALYYAGIELDAIRQDGWFDVCTPNQVVSSRGCCIPPPEARIPAARPEPAGPAWIGPKGGAVRRWEPWSPAHPAAAAR